ncbi:MAG: hypothetical protein GXY64_04355 [Bacteroidales bacterium]|nr:hypothetical protein [Bacteroidales bacterium]
MIHKISLLTFSTLMLAGSVSAIAQVNVADSVMSHAGGGKLSVGGYGEVAMSRHFYSDNGNRYTKPEKYKKDPSHGRFDIPHAVIYLGYDFGKGWTMGTEIEFEHGGTGTAIEYEADESIEFEQEAERGGEVELEQFWLQKSFSRALNLKMGHMVVPFGLTNAHHEPLNYFTVYRPEGENTILPSTWHQTGVSLWGHVGHFRYEAQLLAGLDAFHFSRSNWIQGGTRSPFEYDVANKYAVSIRLDNYTIKGLRLGVSGYYGQSMHNSVPHDMEFGEAKKIKGNVYLGSFDFTYKSHNWIARGNVDYGYVSDADKITSYVYPNTANVKPYQSGNGKNFGSHAMTTMIEVGYDVFSQFKRLRDDGQKLYVFGHYEYYDSYIHAKTKQWTNKNVFAAGINYHPIREIAIKGEYHFRKLKSNYNNEPSINIGMVYEGFFL